MANDDGAARLPSGAREFAEGAGGFEHRRGAAAGIGRAVNPGVMMIAEHDPFVIGGAAELGDHVVDWPLLVIHDELHVNFGVAGAEVIGEREAALPIGGNGFSGEIAEDYGGILRVDRHGGDAREAGGVGGRETLCVRRGGNAGRERIAGIDLGVDDGAALDAADRAPGAVGERVALRGAVVLGDRSK